MSTAQFYSLLRNLNHYHRKLGICSIAVLYSLNSFAQWTQVGLDIDGEAANDRSGYSVSMPDAHTLAVGAISNDGNGIDAGHCRVFRRIGNLWQQKGLDINGEAADDQSAYAISMPDSNTLAIGARWNDGNGINSGHVRVFRWDGSSWLQKGSDLEGEAAGDEFGSALAMPDSNTLAVGARFNDGTATDAGHVRVFRWNGSSWIQRGADIDGEAAGDQSGFSVDMPDSNTLAIGALYNDGNGNNSGHCRIYQWNGSSWIQKGSDLDGEAASDQSGISVSMPDKDFIAIGAWSNAGNGFRSGHVRVYQWSNNQWVQRGNDLDGEAVNDWSGYAISMPHENVIGIGALNNSGNGPTSGHVRIFRWNGVNWSQKGSDIDGEAANDQSGFYLSMPDSSTVAIGAPNNSDFAQYAGHVRVYSFNRTTGIKEPKVLETIKIFPNPASKYIIIEGRGKLEQEAMIYDMQGKLVLEFKLIKSRHMIDLSDLDYGAYILRIGSLRKKFFLSAD